MKKISKLNKLLSSVLLAGVLTVGGFNAVFKATDSLTADAQKSTEYNGNYFFTDYDTADDAYAAGNELNKEIISEGITLLKNESSLPLASGAKVSLFGTRSTAIRYGGGGSGAGAGGVEISLKQSLEAAGLQVNSTLWNFYGKQSKGGNLYTYTVAAGPNGGMYETPVATVSGQASSFAAYSDAAIVVISRAGNESSDVPKGMSTGWGEDGNLNGVAVDGARNYDDHYMQLDQNEADLIKYVGDNFDNVIVLFNTGSQFETGFLDDPGHYAYHENVKGAIWMGYPGKGDGMYALGEIITGKTNPSGHTVDIWSRDFTLDPTWHNMPTYSKLYRYTNVSKAFANYSEGIYMGYRYYETRGFTEGNDTFTNANDYYHNEQTTTTEWSNWYDAHVVYPFGHGLSYTTFDWELVSSNVEENATLEKDATLSMDVKVTNTGSVAGKDVVQLYFTTPYYENGIEKSYVELGAFEKTDLLQPNESQVITIEMDVREMASYDYNDANGNGKKGYELDGGEYAIKLSRDAHTPVITKTYNIGEAGYYYETSESGNEVKNLFADAEMIGTTYLSRADFAGTFPKAPTTAERTASQEVINILNNTQNSSNVVAGDDASDPWYSNEMPTTGANNGIKLEDLHGLDYDDEKWEQFLDQLSIGDLNTFGSMVHNIWVSGWTTTANSKLGIPQFNHDDGPTGLKGTELKNGKFSNFANASLVASTWNKELAYKQGLIIGNQGLFGASYQVIHGLYAPACNIHRGPFGGRNFEYYSEDGYLSGEMAGNVVKGCNEKGMVTFIKHFALNDQEADRENNLTWANEQTMREIYLEPFRICVEDYESHGIMSALNNIGATWTGGSYALITELLRNEWGFEGVVITDYIQGRGQLNSNLMLRAGGDIVLSRAGGVQTPAGLDKPTTVANMRRALHNLYYTIVNFTAAFNDSMKNVLSSYDDQTLAPVIATMDENNPMPYETSVANVSLNNGKAPTEVTYALKDGSSLPEGLTLSADGKITGSAALQSEAAVFTVVASYGAIAKREATFTLPIVDPNESVVYTKQSDMVNGVMGANMSAKVDWAYTLDGQEHEITYSLADGSRLPTGMTLSPDGTITGQPPMTFTDYPVTIVASSPDMAYSMSITIKLNVYKNYAFTADTLPVAKFGATYVQRLGLASYDGLTYKLKTGDSLPAGLSLTENGTIKGIPEEVGQKTFTVVASGLNYETKEQTFTLNIGIAYESFKLDDATKSKQYEAYVNFAQGANDVEYTLTDGKLPDGVTLSKDGVLKGTPTKSGNFKFTVTAKSGGLEDSVELTLHVADGESYAAYTAGIVVGCVGIAIIVGGTLLYVFVINKKKNAGKKSSTSSNRETETKIRKNNQRVIVGSSSAACILLAAVIGFGVMFAPAAAGNSAQNTFIFEAEYVYLDEFRGAGISNSADGVDNIYGYGTESDIEKGYSSGYFLGNTYAENSIEFKINAESNTSGQLILRLASELGNLKLDNSVFGLELNGKEIDYSITVITSKAGSYDFADYNVGKIDLTAGENVIKLTVKYNQLKDGNAIGAPMIDCIKIATEGKLTWNPLTDNPSRRGGA